MYATGLNDGISHSELSRREHLIMHKLHKIVDPILQKSMRDIGYIQGIKWRGDTVQITLDLFIPGHPSLHEVY